MYANHLGAELLSIHTNAHNGQARGTLVFYNSKLAANQKLASSITCYMDELIHAVPTYKNFPVDRTPRPGNHAETKLPNKPNVIVETAFHDNPADAAALKDANFQTAAMKGVEKGYRLFKENQPCKHFKITSIPNVSAPHQKKASVSVNFEGFPQFPVKAIIEIVSCTPGRTCYGGTVNYSIKQNSPLKFNFSCDSLAQTPTSITTFKTTLIDADGVKTKPVTSKATCIKVASAKSLSNPIPLLIKHKVLGTE